MEIPSRECYVLKIYRRDDEDPEVLRGIVEVVETQEQKPIVTLGDLREILLAARVKKKKKMTFAGRSVEQKR